MCGQPVPPCWFFLLAVGPSFRTGYGWSPPTSCRGLIFSMMDYNDSSSRVSMKFKHCQNCQLSLFFLLRMTSSLSANVWKQLRGAPLNCMRAFRVVRLHLGLSPPHCSGHAVIWCTKIGAKVKAGTSSLTSDSHPDSVFVWESPWNESTEASSIQSRLLGRGEGMRAIYVHSHAHICTHTLAVAG